MIEESHRNIRRMHRHSE